MKAEKKYLKKIKLHWRNTANILKSFNYIFKKNRNSNISKIVLVL